MAAKKKAPQFIQIAASGHGLYALAANGRLWRWVEADEEFYAGWMELPDDLSTERPKGDTW